LKKNKTGFEKINCNICQSSDKKILWENVNFWEYDESFTIVTCKNCNLVYLNPRPKREKIGDYYDKQSYWGVDLTKKEKRKNADKKTVKIYSKIYKKILRHTKKGSVFDVGSAKGEFLSYLNQKGFKTEGIELSKDAADYSKKVYGLTNIKVGDFTTSNLKKSHYDIITLNSTLEHLHDPSNAIKKTQQMLKPSGLLIITVPNIKSVGALVFKKNWLGLHPPKHLYHFSKETLAKMLDQNGFNDLTFSNFYWEHSYYSLFNSFRYYFSPRFKKRLKETKKELSKNDHKVSVKNKLVKSIGIVTAHIFAFVFSLVGPVIGRGEVITVYAKKA
jgi:2-polyprenyl-3-methyl-5-hydroxy-6-metoxy-1,4-benzoquinol methylase